MLKQCSYMLARKQPSKDGEETHLGVFRLPTEGSLHRQADIRVSPLTTSLVLHAFLGCTAYGELVRVLVV